MISISGENRTERKSSVGLRDGDPEIKSLVRGEEVTSRFIASEDDVTLVSVASEQLGKGIFTGSVDFHV